MTGGTLLPVFPLQEKSEIRIELLAEQLYHAAEVSEPEGKIPGADFRRSREGLKIAFVFGQNRLVLWEAGGWGSGRVPLFEEL